MKITKYCLFDLDYNKHIDYKKVINMDQISPE